MFGYVKPFVPNLRVKEHELYKSVYCGLCRSMKKHTGNLSRVTLSYDMTFFALVRMALCETDIGIRKRRCAVHPMKKRPMMDDNDALAYAAYVSALFSSYKVEDTLADESGIKKLGARLASPYAGHLRRRARKTEYEIETVIRDAMTELAALEREQCAVPDMPADVFGKLLGTLLSMGLHGAKARIGYEIGLHTGRFVYLIDAAMDYEEDVKKDSYNPFRFALAGQEEMNAFRKTALHGVLTLEADAALFAFRLLDLEGRAMLGSCIENIITDGMESALSPAVGKEETYGK